MLCRGWVERERCSRSGVGQPVASFDTNALRDLEDPRDPTIAEAMNPPWGDTRFGHLMPITAPCAMRGIASSHGVWTTPRRRSEPTLKTSGWNAPCWRTPIGPRHGLGRSG